MQDELTLNVNKIGFRQEQENLVKNYVRDEKIVENPTPKAALERKWLESQLSQWNIAS